MDITEFLRARFDEDQVRATLRTEHDVECDAVPDADGYTYPCDCGVPERRMAEVAAKRAILEKFDEDLWCIDGGYVYKDFAIQQLAQPYAKHPDFRPEWRIS